MLNISKEILIKHLGKPTRITNTEMVWQCPYCKDTHRDNLKYNIQKQILYCFADRTHSAEILKDINKEYKINKGDKTMDSNNNTQITLSEDRIKRFLDYARSCNDCLMFNKRLLKTFLEIRGLTKDTIKSVNVGYDEGRCRFTIPNYKYTTDSNIIITSFEYRKSLSSGSAKEVKRETNTPSYLSMINNYTDDTECLVIVEGFLDGYVLYQHLNEKGQLQYYHIVTPSNGVNSLLKQISEIDFDKYSKFYLYLDNDEAGQKTTDLILEKYPFFESIRLSCKCKDFNEHYLRCIKKGA